MRDEYDFSGARRNPYTSRLKKTVTINIDVDTIEYFKDLSKTSGIPYQTLINMYLAECVTEKKKPEITWKS